MQRVHTLAQRRTVIEAPGLDLHSLQDVHTLIMQIKIIIVKFSFNMQEGVLVMFIVCSVRKYNQEIIS